mgnify:CR=1 FL=1
MAQARLILEWQDAAGGFLRSASWYDDANSPASFEADIQAASNCNLQYATGAVPEVGVVTPGTTTYFLTTDVAVLVFQTVPGGSLRVVIPGPLEEVFGSDGNTVDPTDTLVAAVIADVIGTLTDSGGNVATAYISGVKSSRRVEQS